MLVLFVLFLAIVCCEHVNGVSFALPAQFQGLWAGTPDFNIMGPLSSYLFSISQSPDGDYLFENNLVYGRQKMGYQRFYVEGSGSTAGTLWYCGSLTNFSDSPAEQTGSSRLNAFKPVLFPSTSELNVTYCLDSTDKDVMGKADLNPFQKGCITCDCANWTIAYDPDREVLISQMSMSGSDGHTHSKHMWAELKKIGPPPKVEAGYMPGHGSNFSCEFSEGGRDSTAVNRTWLSDIHHGAASVSSVQDNKASGAFLSGGAGGGCPFSKLFSSVAAKPGQTVRGSAPHQASAPLDHCYTLNDRSGFNLAWTLDTAAETLTCSVSAPILRNADGTDNRNSTYVAIGFRPLSRSFEQRLIAQGTGHHMNFGMEGADIVAGSISGGVRTMYAALYTGPPSPDASLKLLSSKVEVQESPEEGARVVLTFTRPLVGGYLYANYGNNASINTGAADIIWAVGLDSGSSDVGCNYHDNNRGMRVIDWGNPEIAMVESWKC